MHAHDVGWLDLDADPAALIQTAATIEAIARLDPVRVLSGHGPIVTDVPAALSAARRRLASWHAHPERIGWHACKRIFGHLLYTVERLPRDMVEPVLLSAPWFHDHARRAFHVAPAALVPMLVAEMLRSGAATWIDDALVPGSEGPPGCAPTRINPRRPVDRA